jgi:hypothetical protein
MNSSTSSSDAGTAWRRFSALFLTVAALVLFALLSFAYALDPYDTGRSGLFAAPGVRSQGPRTAAASRGRDPTFDAAVFGNSRIQLLSPERLNRKTGLDFVQLSVPAIGPKEQLTLIDWFLRHRRSPATALVIAADTTWCRDDPALSNDKPFPFWLYSANSIDYVRGLLRYDILEELPRRLAYVMGDRADRAAPDGYWDYEADYRAVGYRVDNAHMARLNDPTLRGDVINSSGHFPAALRLREEVSRWSPDLAVVLVFPPAFLAALPKPGSEWAATDRACKAALRAAVGVHPRSAIVDWRVDRPENRVPELYFDPTHYAQPVARAIENDIADALKHVSGAR